MTIISNTCLGQYIFIAELTTIMKFSFSIKNHCQLNEILLTFQIYLILIPDTIFDLKINWCFLFSQKLENTNYLQSIHHDQFFRYHIRYNMLHLLKKKHIYTKTRCQIPSSIKSQTCSKISYMNNKSHEMLQHSAVCLLLSQFLWLLLCFLGVAVWLVIKPTLILKYALLVESWRWIVTLFVCDGKSRKIENSWVGRKLAQITYSSTTSVMTSSLFSYYSFLLLSHSTSTCITDAPEYTPTYLQCVVMCVCLFISIEIYFSIS